MSETKRIQIEWDELESIPSSEFAAGRVLLVGSDGELPIREFDGTDVLVCGREVRLWTLKTLSALGLRVVRIVEEHPHGVVPGELGTTIEFATGERAFRTQETDDDDWFLTRNGVLSQHEVQKLADECDFTVLAPVET